MTHNDYSETCARCRLGEPGGHAEHLRTRDRTQDDDPYRGLRTVWVPDEADFDRYGLPNASEEF